MPSILPDFTLPSNPEKIVRLHEATVADAMDFSEVDPDCEEEATTLFLERLQEKETYSDPRLWSVQDRRFALFMYHAHVSTFPDIPLTYVCEACSKKAGREVAHTVGVRLVDIAAEYTPLEGKPVRDVIHEGHAVIVHPLLGADAERLEKTRVELLDEEATAGKHNRNKHNQLNLEYFLACLDVPALAADKTPGERRVAIKNFILSMGAQEWLGFNEKLIKAMKSLQHGLRSVFMDGRIWLESPPVECPEGNDKEGTRILFPFRAFDYIPDLQLKRLGYNSGESLS